jgi:hypothetical protein
MNNTISFDPFGGFSLGLGLKVVALFDWVQPTCRPTLSTVDRFSTLEQSSTLEK